MKHSLPGNYVRSLFEDSRGQVWVGTWRNGIARYDPDLDGFHVIGEMTSERRGLTNDRVVAIHEDHRGQLWIGHLPWA